MAATHAVIFDIDGVLLHLTRDEESLFFKAFRTLHGIADEHLNPDWNSYRVRNDVEIAAELLERHFGRAAQAHEVDAVMRHYAGTIEAGLANGTLTVQAIEGAGALLDGLRNRGTFALGLATANIEAAAVMRLTRAGLWGDYHVTGYAEAGGSKINILRQAIAQLETAGAPVPRERIVFLGDQLGDLNAARENGVHFIGTSPKPEQRQVLRDHGAEHVSDGHHLTADMIDSLLGLEA
jgi:phosphoglycolate phosphatase-like HAD superfamily hydrolase